MANKNDHKGEEPIAWVTVKGVHFPKWKDGTIGWQNGTEEKSKKVSKETKESLQKEYNELHAKLGYTENPDRIAAINRRLDTISKKLDEKIAEERAEDVSKINPTNLQVFKENSNQLTKALEEAKKQNALEMHYTDATGQTYTYYWDGAKFTRDKINQDMAKKYGKKSGVYEASFKKPANWSNEIAKSSIESKNSRYDTHKSNEHDLVGVKTSGDISYPDMMAIMRSKLSDGHVTFNKVITVSNNRRTTTSKKSDLGQILSDFNMNNVVIDTYRDRAGKNDLKRLSELGYKIQAQYLAPENSNSKIPPRDWYYFVKSQS